MYVDASLLNIITWVAGSLVAGMVTYLFYRLDKRGDELAELERDYRTFVAGLPEKYVAKDDYRRDIDEIKQLLRDLRTEVRQNAE